MKFVWLDKAVTKVSQLLRLSTRKTDDGDSMGHGDRLIHKDTSLRVIESYRMARTNLMYAAKGNGCRVFGVTGASPHDGKSLTAANLAISFAMSGKRVLLIDCDMHRPTQGVAFGIAPSSGLSEYLAGVTEKEEIVSTEYENLSILVAGRCPPNPAELLYGGRFTELVEKARAEYDCVFIDLPPMNVISDAAIVAPVLDGYVFVVRAGKSDKHMVRSAVDAITHVEGKILGFVLNDTERSLLPYNQTGYYGKYYTRYDRKNTGEESEEGKEKVSHGQGVSSKNKPANAPKKKAKKKA